MRLIDADALKKKAVRMYGFGNGKYVSNTTINQQPTIDAVPVVRCKECKWCSQSGLCNLYLSFTPSMKPDDFCSYGERRVDREN